MSNGNSLHLIPGSEPVFLEGNTIAVLLLHGFTASPYEMKALGEKLHHEKGVTVSIPLLDGHGENESALNATLWKDWQKTVVNEFERLHLNHEKVVVIGMSMGGALALNLAAHYKVDAVIGMGTPMYLPKESACAKWIYPFIKSFKKLGGPDIADKEQAKTLVSLKTLPLHAVEEFRKMLCVFNKELYKIKSPVLLMHSRQDHTISYENMAMLAEAISSPIIETKTFEQSYHILPLDLEREHVYSLTLDFLNRMGM